MDYPPNLVLDDYTKQRLISYLNEELYNHDGERGSFLNRLTIIKMHIGQNQKLEL
jgi:hypothetical protein